MRTTALGLAVLLMGCGAGALDPSAPIDPSAPRRARIVDGRTGAEVSVETFVDALLAARVVYVGEQHDRAADHGAQLAVARLLHARDPNLALGFEMFQHPFQAPLDAFVAGAIGEAELLAQTEWEQRWGFDVALYRPLLTFAREQRIPMVALNARREITRAIARGDALDEAQRAELPELDRSDVAHRALVAEALSEHPGLDAEAFERFYTAQLVWDETMATHVARRSTAADAPHRIVVFAGVMHVRSGLGIPQRAARRGAQPFLVIVPATTEEAEVTDPPMADYLWIVE